MSRSFASRRLAVYDDDEGIPKISDRQGKVGGSIPKKKHCSRVTAERV